MDQGLTTRARTRQPCLSPLNLGINLNLSTTQRVLVTDFDGTLTRHDFFQLARDQLLPPHTPDFWAEYNSGRLTHFEALREIFKAAEGGPPALIGIARRMGLEPNLRAEIDALRAAGWRVVVASAGCDWYIRFLLGEAGVSLDVHANPGRIEGDRLIMELPEHSPFLSRQIGIDKGAIVRSELKGGGTVAFAGDGLPDLEPALLVDPCLRFARGLLATELARRGEAYRSFDRWSDVARAVLAERLARPC
ncbi:MAG: HAD-IB family phosphatase [Isosphaeraceae bacterium]|nr:HAD-IB family phosphatase [Isosphaeraceae bacterium]